MDTERYLRRLWVVMAERYAHRWTSAMGDTPNASWRQDLSGLTAEQWARGIQRLRDSTDEWPPSLPQFRSWCLGILTEREARIAAEDAWAARPPKPYNPYGNPVTYAQLDRDKREFVADFVARRTASAGVPALEHDRRQQLEALS